MQIEGFLKGEDWVEALVGEVREGIKVTSVMETWKLSGGLTGHGEAFYMLAYAPDGSVVFTGFDRLISTSGEHTGAVMLKTQGRFSEHVAECIWTLEPTMCTGDFSSYTQGEGRYSAVGDGAVPFVLTLQR